MSTYRVISCVVGRGCLLWLVCSPGKTLLTFALLHFVLQGQTSLLLQVTSWLPTFAFQLPVMRRAYIFGVSSRRSVGLHRTVLLQLLQHFWLGYRLGLVWSWLVCLEMNGDYSVIFETSSTYCISDSFFDYEGYSISSKGFLPAAADIMAIWVKSPIPAHFSPF